MDQSAWLEILPWTKNLDEAQKYDSDYCVECVGLGLVP